MELNLELEVMFLDNFKKLGKVKDVKNITKEKQRVKNQPVT